MVGLTKQQRYYLRNTDKVKAMQKAWSEANRERVKATNQRSYQKNKELVNSRVTARRKADPELASKKRRDYYLRKKAERDAEAGKKPKRCQACKQTSDLFWDHNHETGLFRGWLCSSCNLALGHLKDCPKRINGLFEYLIERI